MPSLDEFVAGMTGISERIGDSSEKFLKEELEDIAESARDKVPKNSPVGETIKVEVSSYQDGSISGEIKAGGSTVQGRRMGSAVKAHEDTTRPVDAEGRGPKFITRAIDEEAGGLQEKASQWLNRTLQEELKKAQKPLSQDAESLP